MSNQLAINIESYLARLSKIYKQNNENVFLSLLVNAEIRVEEEFHYDNWNGGQYGHALYLNLPEDLYLDVVKNKSNIRERIRSDIDEIHNVPNEFICDVFLEMIVDENHDWRNESGLLLSRNRIISSESDNHIWSDKQFRLFLSHRTSVKKETAYLQKKLKIFGISCFVAHNDIEPTRKWQEEIEKALFSMDALAALLTTDFHENSWADQEVGFAFGRGVPVFPIKLGSDPRGFVGKFQALSVSWEHASKELVKLLIKQDRMVNAYINAIKSCKKFDDANLLAEILPAIEKLSDQQADNLVTIFKENSQIRDSYGFNGKSSTYYGKGLAYHLERCTGREYHLKLS